MSTQTTLARAAARHAADAWRAHRTGCPRCARSARSRDGLGPCKHGAPLWLAHESARLELAEQKRLDALPAPGQDVLF